MRTHKIQIVLKDKEQADKFRQDVVEYYFCDLTHWYCGLDHAGEDTPNLCIIYQGYVHPEIITVEFDLIQSGLELSQISNYFNGFKNISFTINKMEENK